MKYREEIDNANNKLFHWKINLFGLPKGAPGKAFINELVKLINEWASKMPNQDICLNPIQDGGIQDAGAKNSHHPPHLSLYQFFLCNFNKHRK